MVGFAITFVVVFFFFKQKTAYEIGLGIPAEPLFRSQATTNQNVKKRPACSELRWAYCNHKATYFASYLTGGDCVPEDRKSGSAGMPRPSSYAVFCLKKKTRSRSRSSSDAGWSAKPPSRVSLRRSRRGCPPR